MTTARDMRNQIRYAVEQEVEQQLGQAVAKAKAEGHESGLAEGREEGIEENKLATARKMLAKNYPVDEISELTGLSIETLESMK